MEKQQTGCLWKGLFLLLLVFTRLRTIWGREDGIRYTQSTRQTDLARRTAQNGATDRFMSVKSKRHCASLCMTDNGCESFMYNTERRGCKLWSKQIISSSTPVNEIHSRFYTINCGVPPAPVELNVTFSSTSIHSVATYKCREGYNEYGGSGVSTCTRNSTWSSIDLNCTIADCSIPPYQDSAIVDYNNTVFGAKANYLCVKGYSSSGTGTRVCLFNGAWSETDLVCSVSSRSLWKQVAVTTKSTTPSAQREDLRNRISKRCKPKLRLKADFKSWSRVTYLSSCGAKVVNIRDQSQGIWCQSVRGLTKSSWDTFDTSPQREFELFVSDGQSTHMSVDDSGTTTERSYDGYFIWLVKEDQCISPAISNDLKSVVASLLKGHVDPYFDTYYVDESKSVTCGQRTVHVSQNALPTFMTPSYWFVRKDCPHGENILRWNVTGVFYNTETGYFSRSWCPDTCWQHVFDTKTSPTNKDKYIRHLTNGVLYGHNIMLIVKHMVAKAREVILHGGHVTVGVKEFWLPANKDAFSSGSLQAWMIASTTRRVVQCTHFPESPSVKEIKEDEKPSIWFLDSREWDKVLTIDGTGDVLSGSKSTLLIKVNEGRNVRVGVLHTSGMYKALEVDTIDVSSTGHIAVNIVHNADLMSGSGNTFHFSDTCRVVSSIITTEGRYKMYRYNIRAGGNHSIVNDVAKIEWFIEL